MFRVKTLLSLSLERLNKPTKPSQWLDRDSNQTDLEYEGEVDSNATFS